jgi:hypothetical protein
MTRHHQFPPCRLIESADQAEEGALAGAAVPFENHEMTGRDCKVYVSDPNHLAGSQGIDPREAFGRDERLVRGGWHTLKPGNNGMMEWWKNGFSKPVSFHTRHSIIPIFHHSNLRGSIIPLFHYSKTY